MGNNATGYNFDSFDLISYIYDKRKPLLIITIIAVIISTVISFTIKPRFKSTAILFPVTYNSASSALLTPYTYNDIGEFGGETEVEQLLQVLNSDVIRHRIINKYDLIKHYGIDPGSEHLRTDVDRKYDNNISFKKTEFMSVVIEVLDTKAEKAANIANDIANLVDSAINNMQKVRAIKAFKIIEKEFNAIKEHIECWEDSIRKIQALGINDYKSQSERFNEAYAQAIAQGNLKGAERLEEKMKVLSKYGQSYISIQRLLLNERGNYDLLRRKYIEARVNVEQDLPQKFVVNKAGPADKKSYPIRWLIVTIFTLSSFILALTVLIFTDRSLKKK